MLSLSQGSDGTIPVNSRTGTHTQSVSRTSTATFYGHSLTLIHTHAHTHRHTHTFAGTKRTPKIIGRKEMNARTYVHILLQILPESERERKNEREREQSRETVMLSLCCCFGCSLYCPISFLIHSLNLNVEFTPKRLHGNLHTCRAAELPRLPSRTPSPSLRPAGW